MQSDSAEAPGWLAHLRAAFVLVLVSVCLLAALPMPGPHTRSALDDPAGRRELDQWVDLLGGLGIRTTRDELADYVMIVARGARSTRSTVLRPFGPLFRITAAQQGWGLFAYPDTHPHALVIEARRGDPDGWFVLYDSADPRSRWMADVITYRRIRATYNPAIRPPSGYSGFATWIASRVFLADEDVEEVRVLLRRQRTLLPGEPGDPGPRQDRFPRTRRRPR